MESLIHVYTGSYKGIIDGVNCIINITQQGSSVKGELQKGNYYFNLVGVIINDIINGRLSDTENFESYIVLGQFDQGDLQLDLTQHDIQKGLTESNTYTFKIISTTGNIQSDSQNSYDSTYPAVMDTQLTGTWAREELFRSSGMTVNTKLLIELRSDGIYKILGAKNQEGHKDAGYSGDTTTGKWKTRNKVFYILVSGSKHWKPYAKYNIDGDIMEFILEDGERQEWSRVKQNTL